MARFGWIALLACVAGCGDGARAGDGGPPAVDAAPIDAATSDATPEGGPGAVDAAVDDAGPGRRSVLLFSRTTGFRHGAIEPAIAALRAVGVERGWQVEHAEDASTFADASLSHFDVVVFLLTTGDVLDEAQQRAFERWVAGGGGWVGVHSASDTEYDWPFYTRLVGAHFARHPAVQTATLHVLDAEHPSTRHLPETWVREDEWYDFLTDPSAAVDVVLTVDESTYTGGGMGAHHPIAWHHATEGGRAFYTALGHTDASWSEPDLLAHVAGAIEWAAGAE